MQMMWDIFNSIAVAVCIVFILLPLILLDNLGKINWKNIKKTYYLLFK